MKNSEDRIQNAEYRIHLDSNLLGGIEIAMGNKVIDGSIRQRLDHLRRMLMSVRV